MDDRKVVREGIGLVFGGLLCIVFWVALIYVLAGFLL